MAGVLVGGSSEFHAPFECTGTMVTEENLNL